MVFLALVPTRRGRFCNGTKCLTLTILIASLLEFAFKSNVQVLLNRIAYALIDVFHDMQIHCILYVGAVITD